MECPYCKYENRDGVRYCSNCGRPLPPTATATSVGGNITASGTGNPGISRSLTVGSRLQGGRYVIKKVLGEGGMGAALLATDNRLDNKNVVIKELISENTDPTKRQEDERNFKREVLTVAHLDHPLIPNVTDYFDEGLRYFMVQEYVDGENLEARIDRLNQPMKERDVLEYASEVLDVLDYLAQQTPPIVHRDIKPANIVISSKDKRAHLVDFGIARADENRNVQRKQTSALGTPGYAPPEQYQGNADPRSDLYALGATMHHLLTNRDPRNHPPFTYPPARSLNPQLSPDVERLLTRALNNDINQRYQSAAAMKRDVDDILLKRFGVSGNISSYTLGTSGPINAIGGLAAAGTAGAGATAANAPTFVNQPTHRQSPPPASPAFGGSPSVPPPRLYPMPQRRKSHLVRNAILLLLVILLIGGVVAYLTFFKGLLGGNSIVNGIGVTKASNGEYIGISDGTFAFDTSGADGTNKRDAATKLKAGDTSGAESLWQAALAQQSNDAEVLIYQEDQQVLASGRSYITIVVGTMLTGSNVGIGRDDLQGAYVAQKEYNDGFKLSGSMEVRLLIANSGTNSADATTVANQVVQAAQMDKTIVGVMGWPFSSNAVKAIQVLKAAQIPMVSETASSDSLTGISKYFFRVAPSNQAQGIAGAKYVEQTLHASKAALFVDPVDPYSSSLADDFSKQFTADGNSIVVTESYTVGKPQSLTHLITDALSHNPQPDVIYFSGYAADIGILLINLPTSAPPVMGGDALYELGGYSSSAHAKFSLLHFTSFAFPDEWDVQSLTAQKPPFFGEYSQDFDPKGLNRGTNGGGIYGFSRADGDVILSYDAMQALLAASNIALTGNKTNFTPDQLQQALTQINGANAIQGVSGQIAFGSDGNPIDKAFVILHVTGGGFIQEEPKIVGTFLKK